MLSGTSANVSVLSIIRRGKHSVNILDPTGDYRYYPLGSDRPCYPSRGTWMGDARDRLYAQGGLCCLQSTNSHDCLFTGDATDAVSYWSDAVSTPADQVGDFFGDYICWNIETQRQLFPLLRQAQAPGNQGARDSTLRLGVPARDHLRAAQADE